MPKLPLVASITHLKNIFKLSVVLPPVLASLFHPTVSPSKAAQNVSEADMNFRPVENIFSALIQEPE